MELRPGRHGGGGGFMLPISQIEPTVKETWAGIKAMCMEIKSEYVSGQGSFDTPDAIQSASFDESNVIQSVP